MSGSGFFESPAYKKIMGKVYGIGAAVVLAGALFKIQHYPGAGLMLLIGMGTEIVIFLLSAFEPPHEMPDWSLVYPELVGLEPRQTSGGGGGGGLDLNTMVKAGQLDNSTVAQLGDGLKKLSQTASQLSNLSDATVATESYLQNMKSASKSVSELASVQSQSAHNLQQSSEALSASYSSAAKAISDSGIKYKDELTAVNNNLSAINSVYELQISSINAQAKASQGITKNLEVINQHMNQSISDVEVYKKEVSKLSQTLGELNTIYGNMLSAMNVGGQK